MVLTNGILVWTPQTYPIVEDRGSDLGGYCLNTVYYMIHLVYGEHLHCDVRTQIDRVIPNDEL